MGFAGGSGRGGILVGVGLIFRLVELLVVLVPLVGAGYAAWRAIRRGAPAHDRPEAEPPVAAPAPRADAVRWRTIQRTVDEHARTDTRWLEYELDAAKLLDFPLMTDMADPHVLRFHEAKLRAELLRPARAEDLLDDRAAAADYLSAVQDYVTAFDAAESEAIRLRRSRFSAAEQQRLARAQSLLRVADDTSATAGERARSLQLADAELDGLVVLPRVTRAGIERGIAGELDG
jgi:hypothetical protein